MRFHHLQKVGYGHMTIQAANLPLPPTLNGRSYRLAKITVPRTKQRTLHFQTIQKKPPKLQLHAWMKKEFKEITYLY